MLDFFLHSLSDRIVMMTLALAISALFGGPLALHRVLLLDRPALGVRNLFPWAERKLNRPQRSNATRMFRGLMLVLVTLGLCLALGVLIGRLAVHAPQNVALEILLIAYLLVPMRSSLDHVRAFRTALREKHEEAVQRLIRPLARRDEGSVRDHHAMLRAAIEYLARQFSSRLVAPIFWYLLLGLPAMLFVVALVVMDSLFGSQAPAYAAFGRTAARLHHLAQIIPSRLAGALLVAAAVFAPGCTPRGALKGMSLGAAKMRSLNTGIPLGAVAGALGITLGGRRTWLGWTIGDAWIECGTARAEPVHLARMSHLYAYACGLLFLGIAALNLL